MSPMNAQQDRQRRGERGSIMIMTAIFALLLLLMVGLCLDISRIYMVRAELQNAADAAALAAARELNSGEQGIDFAVAQARAIVNNQGLRAKTNVRVATVSFAVNLNDNPYILAYDSNNGAVTTAAAKTQAANIRFVKVTTQPTSTNILFASSALGASRAQSREAVAGASVPINTICDFFPVAVALTNPNPAPNTTMTLNFVQGTGTSATLSDKDYIILEVPDINGNGSPETAVLSAGVTNLCQSFGSTIQFHMTPSANINNGPKQITDGTNTRFDIQANGYANALTSTLPDGTLVFKPDINIRDNITFDQYKNGTAVTAPSHTGAEERRILIVPIVHLTTSPQTYSPPNAQIARFGAFFMKRRIADPQNPCSQAGHVCGQLEVEWIDETLVLGGGSFTGCSDSTLTLPVLYK